MDDKKIEIESVSNPRDTVKSADYKRIYINATTMAISSWDININLGQIADTIDGKTIIEEFFTVIMSPAHAKAMLRSLEKTVSAYEQYFGEILDPETAAKASKGMEQAAAKSIEKAKKKG